MKSSPLERFVHQYEMDRESENEHSQVGDADRLADILLKYLSTFRQPGLSGQEEGLSVPYQKVFHE